MRYWAKARGENHAVDLVSKESWEEDAWISTKPAEENELGRTQVYTDGSKPENKTGYGLTIRQNNREIYSSYGRLSDGTTVYQAELY